MTKHTPGPWFAHGRMILNSASRKGDSCRQVASISDMPSDEMTAEELRANARLIAAGPDLLAALAAADKWVAMYHDLPGHDAASKCMSAVIRAALTKATGEQA